MFYWNAFWVLNRDRPKLPLSLGMGGGTVVPDVIRRDTIREEGRRLHLDGEDLDDFVTIVAAIDDHKVELDVKRIAADLKVAADSIRNRQR